MSEPGRGRDRRPREGGRADCAQLAAPAARPPGKLLLLLPARLLPCCLPACLPTRQTLSPDVLSEIEKDTHRTFPGHKR